MNIGKKFEAVLAKSWAASNINLIRANLVDTGAERPADERIDFKDFRVFNELKSTAADYFNIRNIKPHQMKSLIEFEKKFTDCYGLVSIEFFMYKSAIIVRLYDLLDYCKKNNTSNLYFSDIPKLKCVFFADMIDGLYDLSRFEEFLYELKTKE